MNLTLRAGKNNATNTAKTIKVITAFWIEIKPAGSGRFFLVG
jgi:hypothetical protein